MRITKQMKSLAMGAALSGGLLLTAPTQARDWSISLWGGAPYYVQPAPVYYYDDDYYEDYDYDYAPSYRYRRGWDYYPSYAPRNPVVDREAYGEGGYAPDGTYHSQDTVEDRHSSYYSPGRNQAVTRPRTTVDQWSYGPGQTRTRERTSWIGADGRPHSTTINRTDNMDAWGNTHTDTHVDLKRKAVGTSPQAAPSSVAPIAPQGQGSRFNSAGQLGVDPAPRNAPVTSNVAPQAAPILPLMPPSKAKTQVESPEAAPSAPVGQ